MKKFYRFRSIDNLLDRHNELSTQTIYFAHPEELNDPTENSREFSWYGDTIAWKNLFSHYLFCLERLTSLLLISGEDHLLSHHDIPVFGSKQDFPTKKYKDLYAKMKHDFLNETLISRLIYDISNRRTPIKKNELLFYLDLIHFPTLKFIFDTYILEGLSPDSNRIGEECFYPLKQVVDNGFIVALEDLLDESPQMGDLENIFEMYGIFKEKTEFAQKYDGLIDTERPNKELILRKFSSHYVDRIKELVFPDWYAACFMSNYTNSSTWAHYADQHKGACLIFNARHSGEQEFIDLNGITSTGTSGLGYGKKPMQFLPVNYVEHFEDTNFFTSIGRLPMPTLDQMWYMDDSGNLSICSHDIYANYDQWHPNYWSTFLKRVTEKPKDWEHEGEYRLILHSNILDLSDKDRRKLSYDFDSLEGIIFGTKTKEKDKMRIIEIIKNKCANSGKNNFNFYQAFYSSNGKNIQCYKLNPI